MMPRPGFRPRLRLLCYILPPVLLAAALAVAAAPSSAGYRWDMPDWVPRPVVPPDNPMTAAGVELGRHLFYDKRLSANGQQACASCHLQALAFTDGKKTAVGSTGQSHHRNSMGLGNVAYASLLTWANPLLNRLEEQALVPLFGESPVELGLAGQEEPVFARLSADPVYQALLTAAGEKHLTLPVATRALASFQRSLVSFSSPYDRYRYGNDESALSESARRGEALFFSEKMECFHCHGGITFSNATRHERMAFAEAGLHNTGLYNIGGRYPARDSGADEVTGLSQDAGRFRTPSLRNVAVTAPYFHDGSAATLEEVLRHYEAGGRTIADGPDRGIGRNNPNRDLLVIGFTLTDGERADVIAFLTSLTDQNFLTNPRFADPWPAHDRAAGSGN